MTGCVRLSQILKVFGWIGLTSLGGGRSVYFHAGLWRHTAALSPGHRTHAGQYRHLDLAGESASLLFTVSSQ